MTTEAATGGPLSQELIDAIVDRILAVCKPDKIILFGSAATGTMTSDSDIDLLIVEPALAWEADVWFGEIERITDALGDLPYSFDIKLIRAEWFEDSKDVIGGIAYPANKYGRAIYDDA